ncbi:MAG TPA: hypothetical protein VHW24_07470 [Bryobacteraceae bacterium]|nr:hypothetical protein [Bryobacteraceae bacterium]
MDFNAYLNFNKDVMHYCTMLRVKKGRRAQGFSVQFDETARTKIHHHLDQVLVIFQKLEVDEKKRETLLFRLSALQSEVNQPRTKFDRFAALSLEVAGVVGEGVERSKILQLMDSVARVFYGAQTETQKQLPAPKRPKAIEPPKPKPAAPKSAMDDDIPF